MSPPLSFFTNGWRSDSPSGVASAHTRSGIPADAEIWGQNPAYRAAQRHRFAHKSVQISSMVGAVMTSTEAFIGGGITTANQFVQFIADFRPDTCQITIQSQADDVPLVVGASISSEWFYLEWIPLPNEDPFAQYVHSLQRQMHLGHPQTVPFSWHACDFGSTPFREQDFVDGLASAATYVHGLPIESIVIYEESGTPQNISGKHEHDWIQLDPAMLSKRVTDSHFIPGYAFAPLAVCSESPVYHNHKNWLLKDERGKLITVRLNETKVFCLDVTHPEALDYLASMIFSIVNQWHYHSLHLFSMYIASLSGVRYNPRMTRAQVLRRTYQKIREIAGNDTYITAYQSAFGPAIGFIDAMDASLGSHGQQGEVKRHSGTRWLSPNKNDDLTVDMHNIINRSWMNRRLWLNVLSIMLFSDEHNDATKQYIPTFVSLLGLSGSVVNFSGRLSSLPPLWQQQFSRMYPLMVDGLDAVELFSSASPNLAIVKMARAWGRWQLVCLVNWSDKYEERILPAALTLDPLVEYHLVDFWDQRYFRITQQNWPVIHLDPHSAVLLSIRPVIQDQSHLVATSFHITQGGEITEIETNKGELTMHLQLGRITSGSVWLALPGKPEKVLLDEEILDASAVRTIASGIYAVTFRLNMSGKLEVFW